ncbi:hypothetical protein SAMN05421823_10674 [Catalinimonas alkaloidigena]|uniref:Flavoprotein, HI0933 family n=1 Tax=Catalinimonas alkaloidigena TaxID=1075417 RepID=A0A1G9K8L6_9BACT|nr:NAD(P)/FAD-dependent oxidoreductase [Catalinimonas alkaloidigena]SDL45613.1 hypothetical protein SAMN05421823_10674 [Catalinimonas alkaloidigena]
MSTLRIAVIGGGAAGFFGALACAQTNPEAEVHIFERTPKLLSKVRISGGGRCNVTNAQTNPRRLSEHYPRGGQALRKAFQQFGSRETMDWFTQRGVSLKSEADGRVFPVTDQSETIVHCLMQEAHDRGIRLHTKCGVTQLMPLQPGFRLSFSDLRTQDFDRVLIAAGGHPQARAYDWLRQLDLQVVDPVPSLFTFNVPVHPLKSLSGVSVPTAQLQLLDSAQPKKAVQLGPLLVTHWGFSGPAVIKLSAWEALQLHELNYHFKFRINWIPEWHEEKLRAHFHEMRQLHARKQVTTHALFQLPNRLWQALVHQAEIPEQVRWSELPAKASHALTQMLLYNTYEARGKTTFKEEFVTAGGIDLAEVDLSTGESRRHPGLHFAGEVLNIDGVTGGFNFQAAWTTGYLAGVHMAHVG